MSSLRWMSAATAVAALSMFVQPASPASAAVLQAPAVSWQPVADALSYEVQVKPHGSRWSQATTRSVPQPMWQPQDLPFSGEVDWRVRGVTASGSSAWSSAQSMQLKSATPLTPTHLRASRSGQQVTLSWRTPHAAKYEVTGSAVYWSKDGSRWRPIAEVKGTHAVLRVNPKAGYWFMVAAQNAAGEGSPRRIHVSPR